MTLKLLHLLVALTIGVAFLIGSDRTVIAHAVLVSARPAADSAIAGPDIEVELRFNLRIDRARSRLQLARSDGQTIALTINASGEPDTLTSRATGLQRGAFRLRWQVLALDGHITRGEIPFQVTGP